MRRVRSDRIAGAVLLTGAAAIAWVAQGFEVPFVTDPLGPKALPFFVAGFLGFGGLLVALRPASDPAWPPLQARIHMVAALTSFALYAWLLPYLGFLLATTLAVTALSMLFRGPSGRSLFAGAALASALYVTFVYGLGLSLPLGTLFLVEPGG